MRAQRLAVALLAVIGAFAALSPAPAAADPISGVVYNQGTGTWYRLASDNRSWDDANQAAIDLNGHLVTITSAGENDFIRQYLESGGVTTAAWTGGVKVSGAWGWVTGETWNYTNWYGGVPSTFRDYMSINPAAVWDSHANSDTLRYIVEWDVHPDGPPEAPTSLAVTAVSMQGIALQWSDNSPRETGVEVERSVAGGGYTRITTAAADSTSFTDTDLAFETSYSYRVRAVNTAGASAYSSAVAAVSPSPPVESLSATILSASSVRLDWSDVAQAETGYRVARGEGASPTSFTTLVTLAADATTYTDAAAAAETTYVYQLRSLGPDGTLGSAVSVSALTLPAAPPFVAATTPDGPSVLVEWGVMSSSKTQFEIERRRTSPLSAWSPLATVIPSAATYEDAGVEPETAYEYRVRIGTVQGPSEWSAPASVVTPPKPPTNVAATALSTNVVRLTWTDETNVETGWVVMRADAPDGVFEPLAVVPRNATSYDDTSAHQDGAYRYRVAANGLLGRSAWAMPEGDVSTPSALVLDSVLVKPSVLRGAKRKAASLDVRGAFDTGGAALTLDGACSFEVGDAVIAVPSLTARGKALQFASDSVRLSLTPRTGSSYVAFSLRVTGDAADGIGADAPLTLRYRNGDYGAECTVRLASGRFEPPKAGGVLVPALIVDALSVTTKPGDKDQVRVSGAFDASGGAPDAAPQVAFDLGRLSFTTDAAGFTRKGDRWSYGAKDGRSKRKLLVDYAKGTFTLSLSRVDVGDFAAGDVPVRFSVSIGGLSYEDAPVLTNNGKKMGY